MGTRTIDWIRDYGLKVHLLMLIFPNIYSSARGSVVLLLSYDSVYGSQRVSLEQMFLIIVLILLFWLLYKLLPDKRREWSG